METQTKEKSKLSYAQELDELLAGDPFSIMWIQKVDATEAISNFAFNFGFFCVFVVYYFYAYKDTSIIEIIREMDFSIYDILAIILIGLFFLTLNASNAIIASTINYAILPSGICFSWKRLKKHVVNIPFDKITAINLVNYTDEDYSTIYFGTSEKYNIKRLNFDTGHPRAHITFEKVKNGQKVYELLKTLWKKELEKKNSIK